MTTKEKEKNKEKILKQIKYENEIKFRRKENPLKFVKLHKKQQDFSNTDKILRALFWGNRVGKTEIGAIETAKVLLGEHTFIKEGDCWSFCPSFDEQKDTTQAKLLKYIPESKIVDITFLRKGIVKELVVKGKNKNNKITFKSYEQGREKAQGAGKTLIWFDEEPPKDIFEEAMIRQEAGVKLYGILTMTPIKGLTWVYADIYLKTDDPDVYVSEATWEDNPFLTKEQKEAMERRLTPQMLKVRKEGKFVRQTGLVCPWFDREIHIVDTAKLMPQHGNFFCGIDFGFSAPTCGLWIMVDSGENIWIFDGFYRKGLTNPDIERLIRLKDTNLPRISRVGDSAQASDIKLLNDNGITIEGVKKETGTNKENWDEYRSRLLQEYGEVKEATNQPKLFISKDLVDEDDDGSLFNFLVKEIENLRWEEVKDPTTGETKPKSIWGKQANHAIDALTYILVQIQTKQDNFDFPTPQEVSQGTVKPFL